MAGTQRDGLSARRTHARKRRPNTSVPIICLVMFCTERRNLRLRLRLRIFPRPPRGAMGGTRLHSPLTVTLSMDRKASATRLAQPHETESSARVCAKAVAHSFQFLSLDNTVLVRVEAAEDSGSTVSLLPLWASPVHRRLLLLRLRRLRHLHLLRPEEAPMSMHRASGLADAVEEARVERAAPVGGCDAHKTSRAVGHLQDVVVPRLWLHCGGDGRERDGKGAAK